MVDTRVLKYKSNKFYPLTDIKSVIDEQERPLDELLIISEKAGTINNVNENLYTNALRKTEQYLELNEKKQVEKNLGLDLKFNDIFSKLSRSNDILFDATELYSASISKQPINPTFRKKLLQAIENRNILFASVVNDKAITTAILTFVNKVNDIIYFNAVGNDFRYHIILDIYNDLVEIKRSAISSPFNRYVSETNGDIFHITEDADNITIQKMLTTEKDEVLIPSVGDVFEVYETTHELGTILHYSGIVASRIEVNSEQDIILISNDLKDDFFMIHHIKLEYIKETGVTSLKVLKAYHMIINPHDLELNNRNIIFYNDASNSIFTANDGTPNTQLKNMFKNKYQQLMLPSIGDMFISLQEGNGKELTESGVIISEYDSISGFIIKIISNNSVLDFWGLHTIEFYYDASVGFDSLRIISANHDVIDPTLIEYTKLNALYEDVKTLKDNSNMIISEIDNINGEVI